MTSPVEPKSPPRRLLHRRWLACWIDILVVWLVTQLPDLPGMAGLKSHTGALLLVIPAYYCIGEWRWGRTLGKWLLGIAVVNGVGGRLRLWQAVVRTLFRVLEVNPLVAAGVLAGIVAVFSKHEQRLGDMAAQTYVVRAPRVSRASTAVAQNPAAMKPGAL